jgi:hypothetical protein
MFCLFVLLFLCVSQCVTAVCVHSCAFRAVSRAEFPARRRRRPRIQNLRACLREMSCPSCAQVHAAAAVHPLQYTTSRTHSDNALKVLHYCAQVNPQDNQKVRA